MHYEVQYIKHMNDNCRQPVADNNFHFQIHNQTVLLVAENIAHNKSFLEYQVTRHPKFPHWMVFTIMELF